MRSANAAEDGANDGGDWSGTPAEDSGAGDGTHGGGWFGTSAEDDGAGDDTGDGVGDGTNDGAGHGTEDSAGGGGGGGGWSGTSVEDDDAGAGRHDRWRFARHFGRRRCYWGRHGWRRGRRHRLEKQQIPMCSQEHTRRVLGVLHPIF